MPHGDLPYRQGAAGLSPFGGGGRRPEEDVFKIKRNIADNNIITKYMIMNMKTTFLPALLAFGPFVSLCFISCDDNDKPEGGEVNGKILIETTIKNPDGASGSSYIQLIPDFTKQTLNNKNSIQVQFDAGIRIYGNEIYVFPEFGKDGTQEVAKYTYNGTQQLIKTASLQLPPMSGTFNMVKASDNKAYAPMYNLGKVLIFNPKTMIKTGEIDLTSYATDDNNPDPAYPIIRDGLLYVPLDQVGPNWMPNHEKKQVDVAIIDINTDKVLKVISETKSGLTFPTRPFLENMIFTDENNDLYIACTGGFGMDPRLAETGLVCIRSGETEFDESASWDMSQVTIEGTSYKVGSVTNCKYIGNGKLCAYIAIPELINENPYTAKYSMAVLIDMKAKTAKKIDGIPLSDGHSIFIEKYKDLVVFGVYGDKEAGFFTYNPSSSEVSNGPVIATTGNPIFMYSFE